jgi:hypothetical protein
MMSIFIVSFLRASISIAPRRASSRTFSRASRPAMRTLPQCSRRSVGGSSASYASWDTWRRATRQRWRRGMIRDWTMSPSSRAPWPPLSRSASPLASGPDKQCAGWARALGMKGNSPHTRAPAVPGSTGFRCMPTPRCQPIDGTSWSACCGIRHEVPWCWSGLQRMPWGPRVHVHQGLV